MKLKLLLFSTLILSGSCFSQIINITDFTETHSNKFSDGNEDITKEKLDHDFTIQITDVSKVDSVQIKNVAGNFYTPDVDTTLQTELSKRFNVSGAVVENDSIFTINLFKGGNTKTVTIKVAVSGANITEDTTKNGPCTLTFPKPDCTQLLDFDHNFGEDVRFYDKRRITYVYDFSPKDPNKRGFFKITRIDDKATAGNYKLHTESVNFNTESLCPKDNVKVKIVNVNRFMYDVSIADTLISYDSEPSALFSKMFIGDDSILGNLITNYEKNIIQKTGAVENDPRNTLNEKLSCFIHKYNQLRNKILEAYDPCATFPCCFSVQYTDLADSLVEIRSDAAAAQAKLDLLKEKSKAAQQEIDTCEKNESTLKENTAQLEKLNNLAKAEKDAKADEIKKLEAAIIKLKDKAADCSKNKDEYLKKIAEATTVATEFAGVNSILSSLPSDSELKSMIVFLRNMVLENQMYSLDYVPLNGNLLELKIQIDSKDSVFNQFSLPPYKPKEPATIEIPILKPFVSFSSGSFVAIGKNLQNKTYKWIEAGNSFVLAENGYTERPVGFAALGNVEFKISRSTGFGPSFGVGLTIEDEPRLSYLGGLSFFFGESRQFTLTGGYIGMQVDHLDNDFESMFDQQTLSGTKTSIEYHKEFKVGAFISLTYTPFKQLRNK
ncbi:coiled-coil domain-containing protein [Flavobacterium silvaticum]|uniref:Uncharacterized protein n=1 Tax=Flavobacterium silvaticum TaxID=1852020 RepID=A0A972FIG9_9FLAO|nr:hypothetical protein [Flavobacterium silvaticum]NMH26566.1 hypothetical protein [Flavobacterium silvaticum]